MIRSSQMTRKEPARNGAAVRPRECGSCCAAGCNGARRYHDGCATNFAVPIGIPSRHTANAILRQAGLPAFDAAGGSEVPHHPFFICATASIAAM